jgi:basic amino acid/polyamine antiporter, APA family
VVITGATMGKFNLFNNLHFLALVDQLNCPIVIARAFTLPGIHRAKSWLMKIIHK